MTLALTLTLTLTLPNPNPNPTPTPTPTPDPNPNQVAEQLLGGLRTAPTPQGRLRAVLRAWDAVRAPTHALGVVTTHALGQGAAP